MKLKKNQIKIVHSMEGTGSPFKLFSKEGFFFLKLNLVTPSTLNPFSEFWSTISILGIAGRCDEFGFGCGLFESRIGVGLGLYLS